MVTDPTFRDFTVFLAELSGPILIAAGIVAYILGPFLVKVGANKLWRTAVYAFAGTCAALIYAYSELGDGADLPTAATIVGGIVIFNFAMVLVGLIVFAKNRKPKPPTPS